MAKLTASEEKALRLIKRIGGLWLDSPYVRNSTLRSLFKKGLIEDSGKRMEARGLMRILYVAKTKES
jgi:hypothetical protein